MAGTAPLWMRLALACISGIFALFLVEGITRLLWPGSGDVLNSASFTRTSTRPGQVTELIPNSRNDHYVGGAVRINEHGFRGPSFSLDKPKGTVRLLAVGDSVTFGFGVPEESTWHQLLVSRLNEPGGTLYEGVNAGLISAGLPYSFHTIRSRCKALNPDLILVGIVLNDIAIYPPEVLDEVPLARSRAEAGPSRWRPFRLLQRSYVYAGSIHLIKGLLYRARVLDLSDSPGFRFPALAAPSPELEEAWSSSLQILDATAVEAQRCGVPLVFALFPLEIQLSAEARDRYREDLGFALGPTALKLDPQRRLGAWAAQRGYPFFDLTPAFQQEDPAALFLRDGYITLDPVHPSLLGHKVAASLLGDRLEAAGLIPRAATPEAGAEDPPL